MGAALTAIELAGMIEARIAAASFPPGYAGDRARRAFALALLKELERDHGARYGASGYTYRLALAGVKVSSTAGDIPLLRSWAAKVRRLNA